MSKHPVIIVEDEEDIREGLRQVVAWERCGFTVAGTFENGIDAMAYIREHPVHLVISDILMPVAGGLELAEWISREAPDTAMVIISGHSDFTYAQKAIRYNVRHYLLKPTNLDDIHDMLENMAQQLSRVYPPEPQEPASEESGSLHVRKVREYVDAHVTDELNVSELAEQVFLNPTYLGRIFRKETGESLTDYIIRRKMEKARQLLEDPRLKVYQVGQLVGYRDVRYFYKMFRRVFGFTPQEFRGRMN